MPFEKVTKSNNSFYIMKPTDTLVTKYDIIIPFYTSENVTKSVRNIYDHELCKEVIRLYLLNKLDRIWRNPYGSYYYKAKGGLPEYYRPQILTSVDIEKIIAQKKGGRRKGTGRKKLAGNSPSVTMRVPQYIRKEIQALIDMYAHWCASDEEPLLVYKTSVEQRLKTIEFLHYVTEHEKEYISNNEKYCILMSFIISIVV